MKERKSKASEHRTARIKLENRTDTPSYYVNYIAIGHTKHDFTLSAAHVPAFLTPEKQDFAKKKGIILQEATLQLILPPTIIEGLIEALTKQMNKYEKKTKRKGKNGR